MFDVRFRCEGKTSGPVGCHIVDDNGRVARNMLVQMPADHTRISIVTAAGENPTKLFSMNLSFLVHVENGNGPVSDRYTATQSRDRSPLTSGFEAERKASAAIIKRRSPRWNAADRRISGVMANQSQTVSYCLCAGSQGATY